ncbi:MAG TPA: hypothetical protein VGV37_16940 [Aliidongia sp.]|uniref:hypothetical protein n=1 Tax=Aliidongia sp. TaxID=1914230 RepID=UPI002DDDA01C|nr:hypothetical protein [Aliidongia sp.]HEV2676214.1 hypothetical protein [Aliidongia sp.]
MTLPDDGGSAIALFRAGALDPAGFRHRDHVRVAFEMLRRSPFLEVAPVYADGLRELAARAGRPGAYHETITIGFLALVGERLAAGSDEDFAQFERRNPDLFDKAVLRRWYSAERLGSVAARRTFLLPEPRWT